MTTKNINGREMVFAEVPGGMPLCKISGSNYLCFREGTEYTWNTISEYKLPEGEFKIIGLASSLSEEQWAGIELPEGMKPGTTLILIKEK